INECTTSNPCRNGGSCNNAVGSYTCACNPGYSGTNCSTDVDECAGINPCMNSGTCTNAVGSFISIRFKSIKANSELAQHSRSTFKISIRFQLT
ncbi:hypothetical protein DPMN_056351, partial [Dreissena polymorpha]